MEVESGEEVEEGLGVVVVEVDMAPAGRAGFGGLGGELRVTTGCRGLVSVAGFTSSSEGSGVEGTGDWARDAWGESMGVAIREGMRLVGREAGLEEGLALATAAAGRTGGLLGSLWGGSGGLLMWFRMSCS